MRIISGTSKGRKLVSPGMGRKPGLIRPTSDRVREAVFSILAERVNGADILDLYAGTGALGIEGLSRGGKTAFFVDNNRNAIDIIRRNLDLCGYSDRSTVMKRDLSKNLSFLTKLKPDSGFDLIFVDPPYRRRLALKILANLADLDLLNRDGLVMVEEDAEVEMPRMISLFELTDARNYGDTTVRFYRHADHIQEIK